MTGGAACLAMAGLILWACTPQNAMRDVQYIQDLERHRVEYQVLDALAKKPEIQWASH